MKSGKHTVLLAAALAVFPVAPCFALTTSLDALASFLTVLVLTPSAMQFGTVSYSAAPTVAGDHVRLGTNSSATYGGVFTAGGGITAAGDVLIAGTYGSVIDVSCEATATMTNGTGASIDITDIEVARESATAAFGGGVACGGIGSNVLSWTLTLTTDDNLKVGGQINGSTAVAWAGGSFSTANAGGSDIQIDIVYN